MQAIEQALIQKNCTITFQRNASADGTPPATITPVQPPPPQSKQTIGRSKGKQAASPPPPPQTVIITEPPPPTISEADRMMNSRN
jgi:hypothetical protein